MLARKKLGKNRSSGISNRFECVPWVVWSAKKHQTDCKSNFLNQPNTTQISLNSIKVNSTHIVASSNIIHAGFKFLVQGLHLVQFRSKHRTTNLPISETETFSQFGGFLELHTTQGTTFKPIGDVRRVVFQ